MRKLRDAIARSRRGFIAGCTIAIVLSVLLISIDAAVNWRLDQSLSWASRIAASLEKYLLFAAVCVVGLIALRVIRSARLSGEIAGRENTVHLSERKRAEDEARRAQSFLDTVLESVPAPILVKDAADLR